MSWKISQKPKNYVSSKEFEEEEDYRIVTKNLVYIIGLSESISYKETLQRYEYLGQYGKIIKIVINKKKAYNQNNRFGPSYSAYITYSKPFEAAIAILSLEKAFIDKHLIHASFGTTKYCSFYLKKQQCNNKDCVFLHKKANDSDIIDKSELNCSKDLFLAQQLIAIKVGDIYNSAIKEKIMGMKNKNYKTVFPSPDLIYQSEIVIQNQIHINEQSNFLIKELNNDSNNIHNNKNDNNLNSINSHLAQTSSMDKNTNNHFQKGIGKVIIYKKNNNKRNISELLNDSSDDDVNNNNNNKLFNKNNSIINNKKKKNYKIRSSNAKYLIDDEEEDDNLYSDINENKHKLSLIKDKNSILNTSNILKINNDDNCINNDNNNLNCSNSLEKNKLINNNNNVNYSIIDSSNKINSILPKKQLKLNELDTTTTVTTTTINSKDEDKENILLTPKCLFCNKNLEFYSKEKSRFDFANNEENNNLNNSNNSNKNEAINIPEFISNIINKSSKMLLITKYYKNNFPDKKIGFSNNKIIDLFMFEDELNNANDIEDISWINFINNLNNNNKKTNKKSNKENNNF